MLVPTHPVPNISLRNLDGEVWSLSDSAPENFTMLVVYRGLHCPLCKTYLGKLNRMAGDLKERGIDLIVASSDSIDRARTAKEDWDLDKLDIYAELPIDEARTLGLFISEGIGMTSIGVEEPALFSEPGLFMIRPDQTLYFSDIQTMPFLRPDLSGLVANLDFILSKGYPARGAA